MYMANCVNTDNTSIEFMEVVCALLYVLFIWV